MENDEDANARRERMIDALDTRPATVWNTDPRNRIQVMSWGDFSRSAAELGIDPQAPMSWNTFRKIRSGDVRVKIMVPWDQLTDDD
jgi:hypothetical protein